MTIINALRVKYGAMTLEQAIAYALEKQDF
jgi:hypothetical protein